MTNASRIADGVHAVSDQLTERLRAYITAQYHIRDQALIAERDALLREYRSIASEPYIEATPAYELGREIAQLDIPTPARSLLSDLIPLDVGVFPRPYLHQDQALTAFLRDRKDVIVATGTGSGKTETFLFSILGNLAIEASESPSSASMPGVRALMLYPMNALVNDQLARVRRLFGDREASKRISVGRSRPVRFASYTGRTPYPGKKTSQRDGSLIRPLFEEYYVPLESRPEIVEKLTEAGKWPSKDLKGFYAENRVEHTTTSSGHPRTRWHWEQRLFTQASDRELLTRHEIQAACPDLLITNYSMLEYMLLRPIERGIFEQTKLWLQSDKRNVLTIVLDEAHLYTGVAGAEVALLLRRLIARLGIARDRVRFILTSASFGSGANAKEEALFFARELTGARGDNLPFELVTGTLEHIPPGDVASSSHGSAFSSFDISRLDNRANNWPEALEELRNCFTTLGYPLNGDRDDQPFRAELGHGLLRIPVVRKIMLLISGTASSLRQLASTAFPELDQRTAEDALSGLLALCSYARRADERAFLSTRVHMLFRGLPGLYACIDPNCSSRRVSNDSILGHLYTDPRISCNCNKQGRVFELLTHRDCGAAFIRAFILGPEGTFLWNERYEHTMQAGRSLSEVQLLVERQPHRQAASSRPAWVDITTGTLSWNDPGDSAYRKVYAPERSSKPSDADITFDSCPVCLKAWRADSQRIMDHETKGEDPFAALVATQLKSQPPTKPQSREYPNGGKKVLLFSDGRQKAARLARDLPRVVERDVFRQTIAAAAVLLASVRPEAILDKAVYVAFLSILIEANVVLFDGESRDMLERDLAAFAGEHDGDLNDTINRLASDLEPSMQYSAALLRQLCSRFYSLLDTTIGSVWPTRRSGTAITAALTSLEPSLTEDDSNALCVAWIQRCLDNMSFDPKLDDHVRWQAGGHPSATGWGTAANFAKTQQRAFEQILSVSSDALAVIADTIARELATPDDRGSYLLTPRKLALTVDLSRQWIQCEDCTRLSAVALRQHCLYCGSERVEILSPSTSRYLAARKNYWREPVADALRSASSIESISVEEHTAQLSHRDKASVQATTERYELRFQDLLINERDRPIDVLSCTTTMEVGIDIGSLLAVGMRNVPPQRSNYQQRAGRAGRRGSTVSTVITYAQNGPHDSHYFNHPEKIVAGAPPSPKLKTDNKKIARRHIHSYLIQTFFDEAITSGRIKANASTSRLDTALGTCQAFFLDSGPASLPAFASWVQVNVIKGQLSSAIALWLPTSLLADAEKVKWIKEVATDYVERLSSLYDDVRERLLPAGMESAETPGDDGDTDEDVDDYNLLEYLFEQNLLPTYAFPTRLVGFRIEEYVSRSDWAQVRIREYPTQSIDKALSEYAPGRLIVINKKRYRSGGVIATFSYDPFRKAAPLFDRSLPLIYCVACSFVQEHSEDAPSHCPVCRGDLTTHITIQPQVFLPERGRELRDDDSDQDITYATMAQFPVPIGEDLRGWRALTERCAVTYTTDRHLLTVNKGKRNRNGQYGGFFVCDRCGFASPDPPDSTTHERPYLLGYRVGRRPTRCNGTIREVYLGGVFTTDLLLVRFKLGTPLLSNTSDPITLRVIEDALYSSAEAIKQAACRHPQLDIAESELGSGFRLNPIVDGTGERFADLYLFDASAGGAGYSELAERYIDEILGDAIGLLEQCPTNCQTSCQDCLRHFHNQHLRERLDRHLACDFLNVVTSTSTVPEYSEEEQSERLLPLRRMLELSGISCGTTMNGTPVPLSVNAQLTLRVRSGILDPAQFMVDRSTFSVSSYDLIRDLPSVHSAVLQRLN